MKNLSLFALAALFFSHTPLPALDAATPEWFKRIDRIRDGRISREELPDLFDQIDSDKDGIGTVAELTAHVSKAKARPASPAPGSASSNEAAARGALPDNVEKRPVTVWSDGTRMAGDLYRPKNLAPDAKAPAIVLCAGTGGTQARIAPVFAKEGYVVLAFDYRGWGLSESQLMAVEQQPASGENNEMTIKVRALRWQMSMTDQTEDIRAAISFIAGEPGADKDRIGLWGSSYGGGLVTYMAGADPRVKCTAAQVPGGLAKPTPARDACACDLATKQARGETEPVPLETGRLGGKMARYENMRVNPAKSIGYSALEAAAKIKTPLIFVVAENEELSNAAAVEQAHQALSQRGIRSKYHIIRGITHYGVYRDGFEEATPVEIEWFNEHLKPAK